MESKKETGILCHITSLPNQSLEEGHIFVDWLSKNGFDYWQLLPLTPPDKYASPYASPSAFAGWSALCDSDATSSMEEDEYWLNDWALYCAIKVDQGGKPWYEWPEELKNRDSDALSKFNSQRQPFIEQQANFMSEIICWIEWPVS